MGYSPLHIFLLIFSGIRALGSGNMSLSGFCLDCLFSLFWCAIFFYMTWQLDVDTQDTSADLLTRQTDPRDQVTWHFHNVTISTHVTAVIASHPFDRIPLQNPTPVSFAEFHARHCCRIMFRVRGIPCKYPVMRAFESLALIISDIVNIRAKISCSCN